MMQQPGRKTFWAGSNKSGKLDLENNRTKCEPPESCAQDGPGLSVRPTALMSNFFMCDYSTSQVISVRKAFTVPDIGD